ncbi:MAG: hypothetical protein QNK04_04830 [Myxococcota bacterium]|nr:hypothetical protein [Myxococcota bacterium]
MSVDRARCRAGLLLAVAAWLLDCGAEDGRVAPGWPDANLLVNPGFESGGAGWSTREQSPHWGRFLIVDRPVHAGERAVHLRLHHTPTLPARRVKVYGVLQELEPENIPEVVGGYYRVDRWEKSAPATDLYLQVVAIVWGEADARAVIPTGGRAPVSNHQLRYYLAGLEEAPFRLQNARAAFLTKGEPRLGVWQRFEIPLRDDFERLWGRVPRDFERLTILFEARWDNMPASSSVFADVYYDDLYVGPAAASAQGG